MRGSGATGENAHALFLVLFHQPEKLRMDTLVLAQFWMESCGQQVALAD